MDNKLSSGSSEELERENTGPLEDELEPIDPQLALNPTHWIDHYFQRCLNTMEKVQPILAASAMLRKAQKNFAASAAIEDEGTSHDTPQREQTPSDLGTNSSWTSDSDSDIDWIAKRKLERQLRRLTRRNFGKRFGGARFATKIPAKEKKTSSNSSRSEIGIPLKHEQKNLKKMVGKKKIGKNEIQGNPGRFPTRIPAKQEQIESSSSDWESMESEPRILPEIQAKRNQSPTDLGGSFSGTTTAVTFMRCATELSSQQSDSCDSDIAVQATPESDQFSSSVTQCVPATQSKEAKRARTHSGASSSGISIEDSLTGYSSKIDEKQKQIDPSIKIQMDDRDFSATQRASTSNLSARPTGEPPEEYIYYNEVYESGKILFCCKLPHCTKQVVSKSSILRHIEQVHKMFIIHCRSCRRVYSSGDAYKEHRRYYGCDVVMHICRFCNEVYKSAIPLLRHEMVCKKK